MNQPIAHSKILEITPSKLTYLLDYAEVMKVFSLCVGLFLSGIIYGSLYSLRQDWLSASNPFIKVVIICLFLLPPLIVLWLMQTMGFSEVWLFDSELKEVSVRRRLVFGERLKTYQSQVIDSVQLHESIDGETNPLERYQVILFSSTHNLDWRSQQRTLYTSPTREKALEMTMLFRQYLGLTSPY